jgi:hypothetical protein
MFHNNPGLAAIELTDGRAFGGTWWSSPQSSEDFIELLNEQKPNSVVKVVITGHADQEGITVGYDYSFVSGLVGPLSGVLAPNATVYLNGCHSANAALEMSKSLPGVTVVGYGTYALGLSAVGFNDAFAFSGVAFKDGKEQ